MLDKVPTAEYPSTQAALWQRCLEMSPTARRDAAELAKRGITAAKLVKFDADTATFGAMDPDEVLVQEGKVVTDDKDATEVALETAIQAVMDCVVLKDDARTPGYKRFGVSDVSSLSQAKLHMAATMVVKQGRKYLADYAGVGLTADMLTAVETNNATFVEALTTGKEAKNDRQAATDARIEAANALYEELTKLCAAGNAAWRFEDATKADEYVVDHAPAEAAADQPAG